MEKYILITTIATIVFYAIYYFFLRKESSHKFNRFYLLGSLVISLLIPFVRFTIPAPILETEQISALSELIIYIQLPEFTVSAQTTSGWSLAKTYWTIYLTGVAFFAFLFIVKLFKIGSLILQSKKIRKGKYIFVEYKENNAPFSFFNFIFMNLDVYNQEDKESIILHEKIHVRQCHSWDLIFVELLSIVLWFNPIIFMYKRSLQVIHEYLADHRVLQHGIKQDAYLDLLLRQLMYPNMSVRAQNFMRIPGHHFNYLLTKNRFKMLKNHRYSKWALAKVVFVLPLIAFLLMLNCKPKTEESQVNQTQEETEKLLSIELEDGEVITVLDEEGNSNVEYTWYKNEKEDEEVPVRFVEEMPEFVGGVDSLYAFLGRTIRYPANARANGISGQVFIEFVVEKDGSINEAKVLVGVDPELDTEALRAVKTMPKWKPGKNNGEPIRCFFNIPIKFMITNN